MALYRKRYFSMCIYEKGGLLIYLDKNVRMISFCISSSVNVALPHASSPFRNVSGNDINNKEYGDANNDSPMFVCPIADAPPATVAAKIVDDPVLFLL